MSVRLALRRPVNYEYLSPREQWKIDDDLGILDWDPTPDEAKEYKEGRKGTIRSWGKEPAEGNGVQHED